METTLASLSLLGVNYVEFNLLGSKPSDEKDENDLVVFDVNIDEQVFMSKLKRIGSRFHKAFEKTFKCYMHRDMILEDFEEDGVKIYKKDLIVADTKIASNVLTTCYKKHKVPFHIFPSTTDINGVFFCKRLTFRISNRLYINFDQHRYPDDPSKVIRKVFVNYNHDDNVDLDNIKLTLDTILQILSEPIS